EEVRELIDVSPYVKKYTSGVLSCAEADLPPGHREKLMASFERVLMPGRDKDQYSILWVNEDDLQKCVGKIKQKMIKGIIMLSSPANESFFSTLDEYGVPVVVIGKVEGNYQNIYSVDTDNFR
ncbi:hypothetical protein V9P81_26255, partial [Enterobacter hormaechei subsp. hoffmannii]